MDENKAFVSIGRKSRSKIRKMFVLDKKEGLRFKARRSKKKLYVEENKNEIAVEINGYNFSFNKKIRNGKLFGIKIDDGEIQVSLPGAAHKGFVTDIRSPRENKKIIVAKDILSDTDLEYVIESGSIKENFSAKTRKDKYEYEFVYHLKKRMYAKLSDDGKRLDFISKGSFYPKFNIPLPFMYDAAGAYSDAVYFEIEKSSESFMRIKLIADANWINSPERVFPVTIDPEMKIM